MPVSLTHGVESEELLIPSGEHTVAATRFRPVGHDSPLPVLLMSIPYRKDDHIVYGAYYPLVNYLAYHGYEVVVSDLIGTGASTGLKEEHTSFEETEVHDVIGYLVEQEWSTGRIGMFGKSYGARTTLNFAAEQPDGLEAIVPICAPFSAYEDAKYQGGTIGFFHQVGHWLPWMQTIHTMPPSRRDRAGRWADIWRNRLETLRNSTPWLVDFFEHQTKDEFWQGKDVRVEDIDVPILAATGWRDYYPYASLDELEKVDAHTRLIVGPWRHTMPHKGRETAINFRERVVEWFDYFLKDEDNGALDHPTVEFWTERNGGGNIGDGVWRGTDRWPRVSESDTDSLGYAFSPGGLVRSEAFVTGRVETEYEFDHTVGLDSVDYMTPPVDTNPDDIRSLCFETSPLTNAVELTGTGEATVRLHSTISDPLLVVRVVDVAPDGSASLVTYARLKASHRNGHSTPEPLVPGEEYSISIPLKPKSHVFEAGHRIRVAISASFFPLMLSPRDQGSFTILSTPDDSSGIRFPGIEHGSEVTFPDEISMKAPDESVVPVSSPFITDSASAWTTSRDHHNDTATFRTENSRTLDLPHGCLMSFDRTIEATVTANDPLTSAVKHENIIRMDYGTEVVRVQTTSRSTHDVSQLSERVHIDDELVYDETWTR